MDTKTKKPPAPPLYTTMVEIVGWTLDRTADIPKNARFTFGQRLDNLSLDSLELVIAAIYETRAANKVQYLRDLSLRIEQLRALWRLVQTRQWISQQQLLFVNQRLDEAGKMIGGWIKQQTTKANL